MPSQNEQNNTARVIFENGQNFHDVYRTRPQDPPPMPAYHTMCRRCAEEVAADSASELADILATEHQSCKFMGV